MKNNSMKNAARKAIVVAAAVVLTCAAMLAQVETARITGTVTDSSGAVVPQAEVTIIHLATNAQYETASDVAGRYLSVPLRTGEYRVEVVADGFKRAVRAGIILEIQDTAVIDITLEVGAVTEVVDVTADAPLLQTTEASQGQVINNKRIVDLPLNGRDYLQLALLSAGAVQAIGGRYAGTAFSSGGQRVAQNNYLLDGIDNNNLQIASHAEQPETVKPSVDAIQEFKVNTNAYSAEFGRAAGAVVNVMIKSGTNDLHGTVFEFLRNEKLDAKNFFDNPNRPKPPFKRNQYGFAVGGPLKKNKTFLFGDYEATRIRESRTVNNTIPTLAQRTGDFSGFTIFDPNTYDSAAGTRQPFPNSMIPESRIDRVAQQARGWYPTPQNSSLTQNFLFNPPITRDLDRGDLRLDHIFGPEDTVYYRFSFDTDSNPASPSLPPPAFGGGGTSRDVNDKGNNMVLVWNHILSPTIVTSTRLGWNRMYSDWASPVDDNANSQLGLSGVNQAMGGTPFFNISGVTNLGVANFTPNLIDSQTRQLVSDTTWTVGKHSVKFGINFVWLQSYITNPQQELGQFIFNGNFTRNPTGNVGGRPFADFLLGIPFRTDVSNSVYMNMRAPWYHYYIQDEWRATSRLTLNFGIRYELNLPWVEKDDTNIANFDIDTDPANPIWRLPVSGGSRLERATVTSDKTNFAPRFGFAYRLREGTVVRGGYGIFMAQYESTGGGQFLETNPPFHIKSQISTDSINPSVILQDGVPAGTVTPERAVSLRFSSFERDAPWPIAQQWNFNVQHELAQDLLWEVGYYGSKSNHLVRRWNANYALPGPGNINSRRLYTSAIFPTTDIVVGPLAAMNRHNYNGNSLYHSLQSKIERRFSGGFTLLGSYIFSRAIGDSNGFSGSGVAPGNDINNGIQDPLDWRAERSLDNQHIKHRAVFSYIYELPFGRGRRFGADWGSVPSAILGGWTVGGITSLNSGQPLNPTVRGNPANTGDINRPNVLGAPHLGGSQRTLDRFFNTDAFVPNEPFAYGNSGRNVLEGPGRVNFDFSLYKRFNVTERIGVQFRFEAFNFFNTPPFGFPNAEVGNVNFGRITGAGRPRNLQFGLKIIF